MMDFVLVSFGDLVLNEFSILRTILFIYIEDSKLGTRGQQGIMAMYCENVIKPNRGMTVHVAPWLWTSL